MICRSLLSVSDCTIAHSNRLFCWNLLLNKNSTEILIYSEIIRCALEDIDFDMDDIYDFHYDSFEINVLDQWLNKSREYIEQDNWKEAILIAKACLEEYAEWTRRIDVDPDGYISEE